MFCLCPVPAKVAGEGRGELDSRVSVDGLEKVTPLETRQFFGINSLDFWCVLELKFEKIFHAFRG